MDCGPASAQGNTGKADRHRVIGFLLVPNFSMIAFTSAIEPLRLANRAAGRALYSWRLYAPDGRFVVASNGIEIAVDGSYGAARDIHLALVVAGIDVESHPSKPLIAALRRLATFGVGLGAACTGSYVLAKAGLLDGYQATIHWENHQSLTTDFPDLEISSELFEIDRNRYTCAGGTAAIDMMLSLIASDHGPDLARAVTDQLIHHRIREGSERQRMDLRTRLGVAHPKLLAVVAEMEDAIEQPLSCVTLARRAGLSTRQLERLFAKYLQTSPTRYYITVRLERAQGLLQKTSLSVLAVAIATGFASASHFSKSYSECFGHTPSAERRSRGAQRPSELVASEG